ncbi:hypothetical protein AB0P28_14675 [Pseudarthrobacter sp. NPDC089323]
MTTNNTAPEHEHEQEPEEPTVRRLHGEGDWLYALDWEDEEIRRLATGGEDPWATWEHI